MSQIVTPPSEILRRVCIPVKTLDKRVRDVLEDMIKTLKATKEPEGVGLAAPQIGIPLRIFLARPDPKGEISIFINPEITHYSQRTTHPTGKKGVYEGCLSIPGHYAPVTRSMSVTVKYQTIKLLNAQSSMLKDLRNEQCEMSNVQKSFTGFFAHVIQHEMDHLNGILFIDRVLEQGSKLYRVVGKEWEEVGI
ncbi:MAG: peptide deformylase [Patescibacteria group bacterium]